MATSLLPDSELIKQAWACKCPKCGQGDLYKDRIQPTINEKCSSCGMALSEHDCGDGASALPAGKFHSGGNLGSSYLLTMLLSPVRKYSAAMAW